MTDRTSDIREHQRVATAALADLLTRDLPPLYWFVRPHMALEHLDALPSTDADGGDDDTRLSAMHAWSAALGVAVTAVDRGDHVEHTINARHMGAAIRISLRTASGRTTKEAAQ